MCRFQRMYILFVLVCCIVALAYIGDTSTAAEREQKVYLPVIMKSSVSRPSPFGIEINPRWMVTQTVFARANELGVNWVRIHMRSWRIVQPTRDAEYDWAALLAFEQDLIGAQIAGLTPIVVIQHSPHWATKTYYDANNEPYQTSCGAIREDRFADFARFMQALVSRYRQPPFNVRYWELGNEPDFDPNRLPRDEWFGCWGDIDDPYYGGEHYGNMLKVVAPAIRAADPSAQILNGGLSLGYSAGEKGYPENFMEGILRVGAGDSFDIAAYHVYPEYGGYDVDRDLKSGPWEPMGGMTIGKAKFLREVMARYGVEKPLMLNETGLMFSTGEPGPDYFEAQADHIVRLVTRALSVDIMAICWYTLNGPGWRYTSLLDGDQLPRPGFMAYQHLIKQAGANRTTIPVTDYGPSIEAYRFTHGVDVVDVLWSREATPQTVRLPRARVIRMYERDGAVIPPTIAGGQVTLEVGVSPVYVRRMP